MKKWSYSENSGIVKVVIYVLYVSDVFKKKKKIKTEQQ